MDGLIIDSEPFWRQAEIEIFGEVGVALTEADCLNTMGFRLDEVIAYWWERRPWQGMTHDEMETAITNANLNNDELRRLSGIEAALSQQSKTDLDIFLPREIDPLQVMADVTTISLLSRVEVVALSTSQAVEANPDVVNQSGDTGVQLTTQDFLVQVSGSYEEFKTFLRNLERNKYLLEVVSLTFTGEEVESEIAEETEGVDGVVNAETDQLYNLTLRAYAYSEQLTSNEDEQ